MPVVITKNRGGKVTKALEMILKAIILVTNHTDSADHINDIDRLKEKDNVKSDAVNNKAIDSGRDRDFSDT